MKLTDVEVALADAKVPQLTPLRDQPSEIMVNAGNYKSTYVVGGLRLSRSFYAMPSCGADGHRPGARCAGARP